MNVRISKSKDLVSINAIRKEISEDPEDGHTLGAFTEDIITEKNWQVTFVCEIHGVIVGYLNLGTHDRTENDGQVAMLQLFVSKTNRNNGIGFKLIEFAKEYCLKTKKFVGIVLTVLKGNSAKRLYEKAGFSVSKEDHGYWMWISLE